MTAFSSSRALVLSSEGMKGILGGRKGFVQSGVSVKIKGGMSMVRRKDTCSGGKTFFFGLAKLCSAGETVLGVIIVPMA